MPVQSNLLSLEILIATMNRTNLDFLQPMFQFNPIEGFTVLIVNQTTPDKLLLEGKKNVRVVNRFQIGLCKSRNVALRESKADICLIADDDVIYEPGLKWKILKAYERYPNADFISFQAKTKSGDWFQNYPNPGMHNAKSLKKINSIVMSLSRKKYIEDQLFFNTYFGLNGLFKGAEEYVFLHDALVKGFKLYHDNTFIVTHPEVSSGHFMGSDQSFVARTALARRYLKSLSYLWLIKYTLWMWKDGYITIGELSEKFRLGIWSIKQYHKLEKLGKIDAIPTDRYPEN
ncbi:MAG: glycosyltransferase family A protein [Flavobacteriaceae bacterium]|nr:glycosyltransferase family A protein [Flavobacteriaceae bacterium]